MKTISNPFLEKLNEKNLSTWYMLPLIELSVKSFGEFNFINSYQVTGKAIVAVSVRDPKLCSAVRSNQYFKKLIEMKDISHFLFDIPEYCRNDYRLFLEGKYSRMSDGAKQKIRKLSGLKYEVEDSVGNKLTDAIIMALDNHQVLRNKWKEIIGTSEYWLPEESLSVLKEASFITIENI
jgi:hypothetical protein